MSERVREREKERKREKEKKERETFKEGDIEKDRYKLIDRGRENDREPMDAPFSSFVIYSN